MPNKTCPKCSEPMNAAQSVCVIPAATYPGSGKPISDHAGIQVVPHVCPKCNYVELYYEPPHRF